MAGRGNLLRQFLLTTGGSNSEGSGTASGLKGDSGLDTNSPSMTVRSQGRGKLMEFISNSSSDGGGDVSIPGGRGRAALANLGLSSSIGGGDDSDSAVGSAIGSIPPIASSGRGAGRGHFLKCLQSMADISLDKNEHSFQSTRICVEKSKETSKDEAISSMEISVPEEVPRDPVIMKGKAGESFSFSTCCVNKFYIEIHLLVVKVEQSRKRFRYNFLGCFF